MGLGSFTWIVRLRPRFLYRRLRFAAFGDAHRAADYRKIYRHQILKVYSSSGVRLQDDFVRRYLHRVAGKGDERGRLRFTRSGCRRTAPKFLLESRFRRAAMV